MQFEFPEATFAVLWGMIFPISAMAPGLIATTSLSLAFIRLSFYTVAGLLKISLLSVTDIHTLSHTHTAPLPSILLIIPHREKYAHNNFIMHYMKFMFRYFFHYISSENIAKISLKASRKRTISAPNRVNIYKNQKSKHE